MVPEWVLNEAKIAPKSEAKHTLKIYIKKFTSNLHGSKRGVAGVRLFSALGARVEPEAAWMSPGAVGGTFGVILDGFGGPPGLFFDAPGTRGDPNGA